MGVTAKSLIDGVVLTDSLVTYYTTPASTKAKIAEINLSNDHSVPVTVGIHAIPTGGSATAANRMFKSSSPDGLVLAAGETKTISLNTVLEAGGFLQLIASVTNVIGCRASGYEIVG